MRYAYIAAFIAACLFTGCAKSVSDARSEDVFTSHVQTSPAILELDAELDALEIETETLEDSYNSIQSNVLLHTDFYAASKENIQSLAIYINDNNILVVNGKAMSRNDFSNFVIKNLPALCKPTPRLSIHKKANYDTAAWVLEMLYAQGCSKVDID